MQPHDAVSVVEQLRQTTFLRLFQAVDDSAVNRIWGDGRARNALQAVVRDAAAESGIRFLAAEILLVKDPGYPPSEDRAALSEIYAMALKNAPAVMANPWGLPGMFDGQIAGHVLRLGEAGVAPLRPLLDDPSPVVFSGSKDATYGNRYAWRVKDIAASLIARIRNLPFVPDPEPAARDQLIAHLKSTLDSTPRS
ncbi:MAG TPA: hypothetical protein VG225_03385 [Terracidiphilus sp.]|jgi:hypothetical protein|nr:hypothetical protein [Terracidiphilus sp.]